MRRARPSPAAQPRRPGTWRPFRAAARPAAPLAALRMMPWRSWAERGQRACHRVMRWAWRRRLALCRRRLCLCLRERGGLEGGPRRCARRSRRWPATRPRGLMPCSIARHRQARQPASPPPRLVQRRCRSSTRRCRAAAAARGAAASCRLYPRTGRLRHLSPVTLKVRCRRRAASAAAANWWQRRRPRTSPSPRFKRLPLTVSVRLPAACPRPRPPAPALQCKSPAAAAGAAAASRPPRRRL